LKRPKALQTPRSSIALSMVRRIITEFSGTGCAAG
jgi:hypothetical protein